MTFNTTQVYEGLATHLSAATEDPFTEVLKQNSRPALKKSKSFTELQQLYEMEIVESVDEAVRDDALNSDSIFKKFLYYASTAIGEVEGTTPMHAHRDRSQIRRAYKDAPKVYRESKALLQDLWHGRSLDDSRLDAYGQLFGDWAANCTGVMSGFVGGGKLGRGRASWMRTPHQQAAANGHLRPGIPLYNPANQNRAPAGTQRSANANRLYEDMRAVANGGSTHKSAFSDLGARTAGTKFGMPERMSGEQWINRSTNVPSISASSSGGSNAGRDGSASTSTGSSSAPRYGATSSSGNLTSDKRASGYTSKLGRTLDGKKERKGKEREGGPR
ncbi:hypothetical protein [Candidatus Odyssella thessalonicensis]|uniref:hypothetical protein n=1 Tax=Candidatus Odyssella thessalonicensis TaxID=84647 RepID=UPI000225BFB8|nr:hypothetical protein [Candidatus Odyssella thessalonicensis]